MARANKFYLEIEKAMDKDLTVIEAELSQAYIQGITKIEGDIKDLIFKMGDNPSYPQMLQLQGLQSTLDQVNQNVTEVLDMTYTQLKRAQIVGAEYGFMGAKYEIEQQVGQVLNYNFVSDQRIRKIISMDPGGIPLSDRIYGSMKYDVQRQIKGVITSGLVTGAGYTAMSRNLQAVANTSAGKARTIIRTEAGRVQSFSRQESLNRAKEAGADLKKKWVSTLDRHTRISHQYMDGQVIETNENFTLRSGNKAPQPRTFGIAKEDINCRCGVVCEVQGMSSTGRRDGVTKQEVKAKDYKSWLKKYHPEDKKALDELLAFETGRKPVIPKPVKAKPAGATTGATTGKATPSTTTVTKPSTTATAKPEAPKKLTAKELAQAFRKDLETRAQGIINDTLHKKIFKEEFGTIMAKWKTEHINLYTKMEKFIKKSEYSSRRGAVYSSWDNAVHMNMSKNQFELSIGSGYQGAWDTKFHEEFHGLDHHLRNTPFGKDLVEVNPLNPTQTAYRITDRWTREGAKMYSALQEDVVEYINRAVDLAEVAEGAVKPKYVTDLKDIPMITRTTVIKQLQKDFPTRVAKAQGSTLTDAIGMATEGKITPVDYGFWGHDHSYNRERGLQGGVSETWANYGGSLLYPNQDRIDLTKTFLPRTTGAMDETIEKVVKYLEDPTAELAP